MDNEKIDVLSSFISLQKVHISESTIPILLKTLVHVMKLSTLN